MSEACARPTAPASVGGRPAVSKSLRRRFASASRPSIKARAPRASVASRSPSPSSAVRRRRIAGPAAQGEDDGGSDMMPVGPDFRCRSEKIRVDPGDQPRLTLVGGDRAGRDPVLQQLQRPHRGNGTGPQALGVQGRRCRHGLRKRGTVRLRNRRGCRFRDGWIHEPCDERTEGTQQDPPHPGIPWRRISIRRFSGALGSGALRGIRSAAPSTRQIRASSMPARMSM